MKIYLAARYSRRLELCGYRRQLQARGYEVTARWLSGLGEALENNSAEAAELRKSFAMEDLSDVLNCDCFVAFNDPPRSTASRGGHHVEFGYALGLAVTRASGGPQIVIVGHRENLFCWLGGINFFENWEAALRWIVGESAESLADEFGLSRHLARAACRGKEPSKWRHAVEMEAKSVEQDFDEEGG